MKKEDASTLLTFVASVFLAGTGSVKASDANLTKTKSGQPVNTSNFRAGVIANFVLNSLDVSTVKFSSGTALP